MQPQHTSISVPKPCHEDWDKMTTAQKGRFCTSCANIVHDFTSMSKDDIISFLNRKKEEKVCGRFTRDQLLNMEPPQKSVLACTILDRNKTISNPIDYIMGLPKQAIKIDTANYTKTPPPQDSYFPGKETFTLDDIYEDNGKKILMKANSIGDVVKIICATGFDDTLIFRNVFEKPVYLRITDKPFFGSTDISLYLNISDDDDLLIRYEKDMHYVLDVGRIDLSHTSRSTSIRRLRNFLLCRLSELDLTKICFRDNGLDSLVDRKKFEAYADMIDSIIHTLNIIKHGIADGIDIQRVHQNFMNIARNRYGYILKHGILANPDIIDARLWVLDDAVYTFHNITGLEFDKHWFTKS